MTLRWENEGPLGPLVLKKYFLAASSYSLEKIIILSKDATSKNPDQ